MNEPHAGVALAVLAVLLAVPILLAILVALLAPRGARAVWIGWGTGFLLFAAIATPLATSYALNAEDTKLFTGLIVGTGIATAAAAWVVNRRQQVNGPPGLYAISRSAVATAIGGMLVVMAVTC